MNMLRDLEKLLREAAEQQAAAGRPQQPRRPRRPPPAAEPVVDAEVLDENDLEVIAEPAPAKIGSRHLDTTDVSEHAEHLGYQLSQTDERLEDRLHKAFDHDLTSVSDGLGGLPETPSSDAAGAAAGEIVAMLREPSNVRNAILLAEIINRPEHRW
jgi:hypothetical protein